LQKEVSQKVSEKNKIFYFFKFKEGINHKKRRKKCQEEMEQDPPDRVQGQAEAKAVELEGEVGLQARV